MGGLMSPPGTDAAAAEAAPDLTAAAVEVIPPELVANSLSQYLRAWAVRVRSGDAGILPVVAALVLVTIAFQIVSPEGRFLTAGNLVNLFIQSSVFIVLAMGEGFVLLLGEIDLSMGYVGAIGGIVAANMVQPGNNFPWWLAIIVRSGGLRRHRAPPGGDHHPAFAARVRRHPGRLPGLVRRDDHPAGRRGQRPHHSPGSPRPAVPLRHRQHQHRSQHRLDRAGSHRRRCSVSRCGCATPAAGAAVSLHRPSA